MQLFKIAAPNTIIHLNTRYTELASAETKHPAGSSPPAALPQHLR